MPPTDPPSNSLNQGGTQERRTAVRSPLSSLLSTRMYRRFIRLALASLGLSGCLLIAGYSIAASQHDFLGFELREGAPVNTYLFLSGSMLLDLFLAAVATFSARPLLASAFILALILSGTLIALGLRTSESFLSTYIRPALFLLVLLALVGDILYFDIPTFQLQNLLRSDIEFRAETGQHQWVQRRGAVLWLRMICSRLDGEEVRQDLRTKAQVDCTLPSEEEEYVSAEEYESKNRVEVLLNTSLATFHIAILSLILFLPGAKPLKSSYLGVYAAILIVNILLLPFAYSRVLNPTIFREAIVRIDENGEAASEHGFILTESESALVFFQKKERHVWLVPKERVALIKVERHEDILTHYFQDLLYRDEVAPPPPP